MTKKTETPSITVAGVTFTAKQVQSAVVKIDGREVHICEEEKGPVRIGFQKKIAKGEE